MSLQVWLPLTKDLRQQGLRNESATSGGTVTLTNVGKLGKCATLGTAAGGITLPASTMTSFTECSVAFWINIISWNTSYATFFQAGLSSTPWNNYIFGILRNNANSNLCFTLTNSSASSSQASYVTSNLNTGQWYHLAFTYTAGTVKTYIDGVLDKTYNTSYVPNFAGITHISIGRGTNNSGYQTNCNLNDFRIYDHCLSPMEVKELSKGLVLHYSFSDDKLESTTNLVTREDGLSNTCFNGATSKYGYGTTTDIYKTVGTFQNRKSTKVYMGTAGLNAYPYVYFDAFNAAGTAIQTLSFDYYPTLQNTIIPYSYNGTYNFSYTTNKTSGSANNASQIIIPVEVGKWNHITITAQKYDTTNTSRGIGYIRIGSAKHTSDTSNYWLFSSIQVEAKNHATGYAGVGGTRTSTIVYDNSGFCNNGTISGALTIASDTPKYAVSTYMSKAALITHPRPVFGGTDQEWSCAMWVKLDTTNQSGQAMNNFNLNNNIVHGANSYPLLYLNGGTNDYYNYGNKAVVAGEWTHIVFIFKNSNATKLIYINGVEQTNKNGPNRTSTPAGIPDTVTVGTNLAGYISDYRVYATALSASDVKSLYQNCATIDADGTIHGQIRN